MKTWLISVACLVIFIGLALIVQSRIENTSRQMEQSIKTINSSLTHKLWGQALIKLQTIKHRWQRSKSLWAMLIHHRELDSIDQALVLTIKAVQCQDYSEAQMELGSLLHFVRHIPEREKFNLVNIF